MGTKHSLNIETWLVDCNTQSAYKKDDILGYAQHEQLSLWVGMKETQYHVTSTLSSRITKFLLHIFFSVVQWSDGKARAEWKSYPFHCIWLLTNCVFLLVQLFKSSLWNVWKTTQARRLSPNLQRSLIFLDWALKCIEPCWIQAYPIWHVPYALVLNCQSSGALDAFSAEWKTGFILLWNPRCHRNDAEKSSSDICLKVFVHLGNFTKNLIT